MNDDDASVVDEAQLPRAVVWLRVEIELVFLFDFHFVELTPAVALDLIIRDLTERGAPGPLIIRTVEKKKIFFQRFLVC